MTDDPITIELTEAEWEQLTDVVEVPFWLRDKINLQVAEQQDRR